MENLCERHDDGKVIKLWWDRYDNTVTVTIIDLHDERNNFLLMPSLDKAMDAYNHPYAYQGVPA